MDPGRGREETKCWLSKKGWDLERGCRGVFGGRKRISLRLRGSLKKVFLSLFILNSVTHWAMNNPIANIQDENTAALLPSTVLQHRKQQISGHSVHQVDSMFGEFMAYVFRRNKTHTWDQEHLHRKQRQMFASRESTHFRSNELHWKGGSLGFWRKQSFLTTAELLL